MMKRILILADINSPHTRNWLNRISPDFQVAVFSFRRPVDDWHDRNKVQLISGGGKTGKHKGDFSKLWYPAKIKILKKLISEFKPDILHAHYATSYGLLGSMSGFHPYILSAWGSDVFDFPKRSIAHRKLLKWNLSKADLILSTSKIMKTELVKYTSANVELTPFGIDLDKFLKIEIPARDYVCIGTVKSLERIYGIDILINAFKIVVDKLPGLKLKLIIAGDGLLKEALESLARDNRIGHLIEFKGRVPHEEVPALLSQLDIFVNVSRFESFGVSVLEASACEVSVVVSDSGGLTEVVLENITGLVVPSGDAGKLADALVHLINHADERRKLGLAGRKFVEKNYNMKETVKQIDDIYSRFLIS
jgi:glycosyltransferase involved in cell wall biosynthesis